MIPKYNHCVELLVGFYYFSKNSSKLLLIFQPDILPTKFFHQPSDFFLKLLLNHLPTPLMLPPLLLLPIPLLSLHVLGSALHVLASP